MNPQRLVFGLMYRLGFTPWDGHALARRLCALVEGEGALPAGAALDIGCGTGDSAIYLARHGWQVTGVDFVERALERARKKTAAAGEAARVRYLRGDVTRLRDEGVPGPFQLLADNGCYHVLSEAQRDDYAREVSAVAAPGARFILVGFALRSRARGPRGVDPAEIPRRFGADWELVAQEVDERASPRPNDPLHCYELRRR